MNLKQKMWINFKQWMKMNLKNSRSKTFKPNILNIFEIQFQQQYSKNYDHQNDCSCALSKNVTANDFLNLQWNRKVNQNESSKFKFKIFLTQKTEKMLELYFLGRYNLTTTYNNLQQHTLRLELQLPSLKNLTLLSAF